MSVTTDIAIPGTASNLPSTGLTPDALPETQAPATTALSGPKTGVSTQNIPNPTAMIDQTPFLQEGSGEAVNCPPEPGGTSEAEGVCNSSLNAKRSTLNAPGAGVGSWYALRTTYSRERQAYDYIITHGGTAYLPTITQYKNVNGKRVAHKVSRIPNILFAHGTQQEVEHFVYDNQNLPYLRFYYAPERFDGKLVRRPLIVPERQMESLRLLCAIDDGNIALVPQNDTHFHQGQEVRIIQGRFAGIIGRVARYQGQQRVAVIIPGLITIATAYIPTAFLTPIGE